MDPHIQNKIAYEQSTQATKYKNAVLTILHEIRIQQRFNPPSEIRKILFYSLKSYFTHLFTITNPITNTREFALNVARFTCSALITLVFPTTKCISKISAVIALINDLRKLDTSHMSAQEYADFIAFQAAEITWNVLCDKGISKAASSVKNLRAKQWTLSSQKIPHATTPEGVDFPIDKIKKSNVLRNQANLIRRKANINTNTVKQNIEWTSHGYKHFPRKNVPWKNIVKETLHGHAKYKPEINIKELELYAWMNGLKTTNGKNWKVYKFKNIIGAKFGKETCYIRIECNSNTIHGHPILESEYLELLK